MSRNMFQLIHDQVDTARRSHGLVEICVLSDDLLCVCDELSRRDLEAAVTKAAIDAGCAVAWERHFGEQP